jgi:IDEAL domain
MFHVGQWVELDEYAYGYILALGNSTSLVKIVSRKVQDTIEPTTFTHDKWVANYRLKPLETHADLDVLIDMSLMMKDRDWFHELTKRKVEVER